MKDKFRRAGTESHSFFSVGYFALFCYGFGQSLTSLIVRMKKFLSFLFSIICIARLASGAEPVRIAIHADKPKQEFQGLGCGAIFFEGHITSLAARGKDVRQQELYDDMFAKVPTRYLQLMIRPDHEPRNDNEDPWTPTFDPANFKYCEHTLAIAKAAKARRPDIELFATLYTPPAWMKTNNSESGGGQAKGTLKPGLDLELAEFIWAFLDHMASNGTPIQWLSIANEPDWPHEQPGYFLTADRDAQLFKTVSDYLDKMSLTHRMPKPKLVGPNTLSAPAAAESYVPALLRKAGPLLAAIASHDYDMRGNRWSALQRLAGNRPLWMSEWCSRGEDPSPGQINAATGYGMAMHEAFTGGANVWMAYDWVYPNRNAGESLIHVDWGNDYALKKPYWLFRQWAEPLVPGMRVVESAVSGSAGTTVQPTSFLSVDGRTLVVHIVNGQDSDAAVVLTFTGRFVTASAAARRRTSSTEDDAELPSLTRGPDGFHDTLPARSMVTYRIGL